MAELLSELNQSDVVIRRTNGAIVAAIPQFGLFARGADVKAALDGLEEKKIGLMADLKDFSNLRGGTDSTQRGALIDWRDIAQFATKAAVVVVLLGALMFYGAIKTREITDHAIFSTRLELRRLANFETGAALWDKVELELHRAAVSDIPSERKQKLLTDIHILVERFRPFVAEASRLWLVNEPENAPPGPAK